MKSTADAEKAFKSNGGGVSVQEIATVSSLPTTQLGPTLYRLARDGRKFVRAVQAEDGKRWVLTARGRVAAEG